MNVVEGGIDGILFVRCEVISALPSFGTRACVLKLNRAFRVTPSRHGRGVLEVEREERAGDTDLVYTPGVVDVVSAGVTLACTVRV